MQVSLLESVDRFPATKKHNVSFKGLLPERIMNSRMRANHQISWMLRGRGGGYASAFRVPPCARRRRKGSKACESTHGPAAPETKLLTISEASCEARTGRILHPALPYSVRSTILEMKCRICGTNSSTLSRRRSRSREIGELSQIDGDRASISTALRVCCYILTSSASLERKKIPAVPVSISAYDETSKNLKGLKACER